MRCSSITLSWLATWLAGIVFLPLAMASPGMKESAPVARTLVLVRHGQYLEGPDADETLGPGLSALGIAQARMTGSRLASFPETFDALYVSPLQRAKDTAASIGEAIGRSDFKVLDDLTECTPPTRRKDIMARRKPDSLAACTAQLDRLFAEHFKPAVGKPRRELLVCHGNVIRYLVTRAMGVDTQSWLTLSVGHASLTTIRVNPDGSYKLLGIGDTGHIPPNLSTAASGDPEKRLVPAVLPTSDAAD
ncbi:MAG: histidine phosphatase family protein [Xanthomonadales bacterium]|nr:histidine phosphatase family protein [Xanthomonadales bacterium]